MDERELARRRGAERNTSVWYKLKEGDNTFRILPTPKSKSTQGRWTEYRLHREVGSQKQNVRCGKDPLNNDEGKCWLCDVQIPKLHKLGKTERADKLESKPVLAVQIAKVDDDGGMTGPFIFTPSPTVGNQLLSSILGSKKRDYTDPSKGYNLTLNRTGTGRNDTRYNVLQPDTDPSEVPDKLIKKLKPFSELKEIPVYSEAKQKAAYSGQDSLDDDDEDDIDETENEELEEDESEADEEEAEEESEEEEEEAPKPKAGKKVAKKKPEPEPEEDEELEEEEPEEEEDEPPAKPAKKPAKKKLADEEEDEEELTEDEQQELDEAEEEEELEEEPEEDEEEDEPPPPPKKKVTPINKKKR